MNHFFFGYFINQLIISSTKCKTIDLVPPKKVQLSPLDWHHLELPSPFQQSLKQVWQHRLPQNLASIFSPPHHQRRQYKWIHIFYITCIPRWYISTKYSLHTIMSDILPFSKDPVRPNTFHPGISIEDIGIWKHGIHVIQLGGIPSTNIRV